MDLENCWDPLSGSGTIDPLSGSRTRDPLSGYGTLDLLSGSGILDPLLESGMVDPHPEPEPGWGPDPDPELLVVFHVFLFCAVLELDEGSLKLLEPESGDILNSQPIHAIRQPSSPSLRPSHEFLGTFSTRHSAASSPSLTFEGTFSRVCLGHFQTTGHACHQAASLHSLTFKETSRVFWYNSLFTPFLSQPSFSYFKGTFSRDYLGHSQLTAHSCHQATQLSFSYFKGTFSLVYVGHS
jgi:hypothetical protein